MNITTNKIVLPSTKQEQTTSVSGGHQHHRTILANVDNCTTFTNGNNKSTIESNDFFKFTDTNNNAATTIAILERILLELELILQAKEGNSTPEGKMQIFLYFLFFLFVVCL